MRYYIIFVIEKKNENDNNLYFDYADEGENDDA